jgi:hypothetical protein
VDVGGFEGGLSRDLGKEGYRHGRGREYCISIAQKISLK